MVPSYSWKIGPNSDNGTFIVKVKAIKTRYGVGSTTKTFQVLCASACGNTVSTVNSTIPNNMTNTTSTPLPNINKTSSQPVNMTARVSGGGKSKGITCTADNCTSGTPPPVDCTKNPNDPSCTQTLTPLTPMPLPSSTSKTCPDGSQPDSSGKCPTTQPPSTLTPNTPTPPTTKNNLPSSGDNNPPPAGGSGSDNGGSGSGTNGPPHHDKGSHHSKSSKTSKSSSAPEPTNLS